MLVVLVKSRLLYSSEKSGVQEPKMIVKRLIMMMMRIAIVAARLWIDDVGNKMLVVSRKQTTPRKC